MRVSQRPATNALKTHCKRGHALAGTNLYVHARGARECRTCRRERARARARKEARNA